MPHRPLLPGIRSRLALLVGAFLSQSCLEPTQLTLEISTDALCVDVDETHIVVGPLDELPTTPPSATTKNCDEGRIGSIVLVPGKENDQGVSFEVVLGIGKDTGQCAKDGYQGGCIVARRSLSFVPNRPLTLPIELELECLDVPCGATQTCRNGSCVSAALDDPTECVEPGGCNSGAGGESATGGTSSTGGSGVGGAPMTGGMTGAGGTTSTGGMTGAGGTTSTGGMTGAGGTTSTGGTGGGPSTDPHLAVVTTTSDLSDGDTSSITSLNLDPGGDGEISLREALLAANATLNDGAPDTIEFAIAGAGPHTISPLTALPSITDAVVIDGDSQSPGDHHIEIRGDLAGAASGFTLASGSSGSTLTGLVINRFQAAGLLVEGSASHTIQKNWVGLGTNGSTRLGNGIGVYLKDSPGNLVGGILSGASATGNVLSGNSDDGLRLEGAGCTGNVVQGNIIGLDTTGILAAKNGGSGIQLKDGASENSIGSASLSSRNVISVNSAHGVRIVSTLGQPGSDNNLVQGNYIGTDISGSSNATLGNGDAGVRILRGVSGNVVGGPAPGEGNLIAYNDGEGVRIGFGTQKPQNCSVLGNRIFGNTSLGIELHADAVDGVTPNDAGDTDVGGNGLQNFPEFVTLSHAAGELTVDFTLDTLAGTYRVEFFGNEAADASGQGEGENFLHAIEIVHAGAGSQAYQALFPVDQTAFIAATATQVLAPSSYGGTSEFSAARPTTYP